MGLDMHLYRKHYVKNWDHTPADRRTDVKVKRGGRLLTVDPTYVSEEVMEWRKANAIHGWFVKHCQDGVDDCRPAYVSREQLALLLETVRKVLADHKLAPQLLPVTGGFFFGDYGQDGDPYKAGAWYWDDLRDTEQGLAKLLHDNPSEMEVSYEYQSSW